MLRHGGYGKRSEDFQSFDEEYEEGETDDKALSSLPLILQQSR